jgi:hypothetical protein
MIASIFLRTNTSQILVAKLDAETNKGRIRRNLNPNGNDTMLLSRAGIAKNS